MKVYIACIDWDGNSRSHEEPQKAFFTKDAAEKYLLHELGKDGIFRSKILEMEVHT